MGTSKNQTQNCENETKHILSTKRIPITFVGESKIYDAHHFKICIGTLIHLVSVCRIIHSNYRIMMLNNKISCFGDLIIALNSG